MAGMLGMDIDEVRMLGQRLTASGSEIGAIIALVSGSLQATSWIGPDANRTREEWARHRTALAEATKYLVAAAELANRNADAQEMTSRP